MNFFDIFDETGEKEFRRRQVSEEELKKLTTLEDTTEAEKALKIL